MCLKIRAVLAAVPAPAPLVIEVDGTLVPVDARGHALPRVPAPDAAPTEAALMAVAERVKVRAIEHVIDAIQRGSNATPHSLAMAIDLAAIVKGEKP